MKFLIGFFLLSLFSFNMTYAQTLGNDDSTAVAEDAELNAESFPILKIVPFQWVELTEPTKEANVFNPTINARFFRTTDEGAENVNLDLEFEYFGEKYNRGFVTVNGFLAFGSQGGGAGFIPGTTNAPGTIVNTPSDLVGPNSWGPSKIPSARPPNNLIAPFWADLDFGSAGAGYLYHRTFKPDKLDKSFDHFICEWDTAGFYKGFDGDESHVTFELVLFAEGGIMFQYKEFSLSDFLQDQLTFLRESSGENEEGVKYSELSEFDILKNEFGITIGYEDAAGTRGTSWNFPIASGTSLGNELVPDWVSGTNSDNFLDRLDGRDRRNNAVTSSGGGAGCFISARKQREDR